ncbi:MAG: hypothetical protein AAFX92_06135 [Pseudomonadota bacterium]
MVEVLHPLSEIRSMRTIHLHGDLAHFGGPFCWDVASPAEAVRGLCRQLPGFRARLSEGSFHVVSGDLDDGFEHEAETLTLLANEGDIHFVPAVIGAGGNGGFAKVLVGAALIAASFIVPGPIGAAVAVNLGPLGVVTNAALGSALFSAGVAVGLAGVGQLLSPTPTIDSNESPDRRPSFLFNSGINRIEAGNPVPLAFGLFRVGSVVGSAGIAVEELPYEGRDGSNSNKFLTQSP